jgi:hypothetical protein
MVIQVFVHLLVLVEFGLILADRILQLDFTLVSFVAVVFKFLLHIADFTLLGGEFVLKVFLGLEQAIVVVLQSLNC